MNRPIYVHPSEFFNSQYTNRKELFRHHRRRNVMVMGWIMALAMVLIFAANNMNQGAEPLLFSVALVTLIMLAVMMWMRIGSMIDAAERENDLKLKRAQELHQRCVFFDTNQTAWQKIEREGIDPRNEVDEWCRKNEIGAIVTYYNDYMWGDVGIFISFPDDESMIFFKMKYMDKF